MAQRSDAAAESRTSPLQHAKDSGQRLVGSLWQLSADGDHRHVRRLCALETPAGTAIRLFGALGPAYAIGAGDDVLAEYTSSGSEQDLSDPTRLRVIGEVRGARGTYAYAVWWRRFDEGPLIEDIGTNTFAAFSVLGFGRGIGRPPAEPRVRLDPVALALWKRGLPRHGLQLVLRCLTAWWRIPDGDALAERYGRSVLAATIERMVSYRSSRFLRAATYAEVAAEYGVEETAVRKANQPLQNRLKLANDRPW